MQPCGDPACAVGHGLPAGGTAHGGALHPHRRLGTPARMDGSAYGMAALEHYQTLGLQFDCIYTGYLGGEAQVALAEKAFALWPAAYKWWTP